MSSSGTLRSTTPLGGILTPASMSQVEAAERLHDFLRPLIRPDSLTLTALR